MFKCSNITKTSTKEKKKLLFRR